jgi:3-hydroxybutyryl-CoA dehydrogenase
MEITCGNSSDIKYADWVYELAHCWGKEPTLLRKDLRGFITNRLMYAVYREGLSLVEKGRGHPGRC